MEFTYESALSLLEHIENYSVCSKTLYLTREDKIDCVMKSAKKLKLPLLGHEGLQQLTEAYEYEVMIKPISNKTLIKVKN